MTVESASYISGLDATLPLTPGPLSEGDDHFRLIKSVLKATFPNANGAINPTPAEFNRLVGLTGTIYTTDSFTIADYLKRDGSVAMTGALAMGTQKVTGMADGTLATDAASKGQMDTALALKLNSASYTAADVLTKIKTVDGAGSGLDADFLDGLQGSEYLAYSNFTGTVPVSDLPAGTTTAKGAVELATDTEAYGTSDLVVLTPGNLASIFSNNRVSKGHQKIRGPNGIIIQWGSVSVASDSSAVVTFDTPFPSACRAVNVTVGEANNFDVFAPGVSTPSISEFTIYNKGSGGRTVTMYWIAVGY